MEDANCKEAVKKARANPVYITPVLRSVYNSESSDELPEGDTEYKPASKKKRQRKRKIATDNSQDDDEVAVLEEKINPKTKVRLLQKKKKTSAVQEMLKRLADFAKSTNNAADDEESEDDSHLTCSVCLSSFWYTRHLQEHMSTDHGMNSLDIVGQNISDK